MFSTVQFFDLIIAKHGLPSDYALSKYLSVSAGLISKHRKNSFGFAADLGLKIADALGFDPAFVLLCGMVESAKRTDEKSALTRLLIFAELNGKQLAYGWTPRQNNQIVNTGLKRRAGDNANNIHYAQSRTV